MKLIIVVLALAISSVVTARGLDERIIGGKTAYSGQFPFHVGLSLTKLDNETIWCGGALIHTEWVLTSAVCVNDLQTGIVYLGSVELGKGEFRYRINSKKVFVHYGFKAENYNNNIALIKIPNTDITKNVTPISLPKTYNDYAHTYGVITGWGTTSDDSDDMSETLKWVELMIDSQKYCQNFHEMPILSLCAYVLTSPAPCKGDVGGPLIKGPLTMNKDLVLVGIESFGPKDSCTKAIPIVYVDVFYYIDWIRYITKVDL